MQKLIYASKEECPDITRDIHPNDFPVGWREITVGEFARSDFFTYSPIYMEYRQMHSKDRPTFKMTAAKLFHFSDGTGIAMEQDYWGEDVIYYKFGCDHSYDELSSKESHNRGIKHFGMCFHVYECSKCSHVMSQDSSD